MSAQIIQFPVEAIYRRPPTLENTESPRERKALIDALSVEEQTNLESQLARDLFAAVMARNRHSMRPERHPKAGCPAFGEPVELEEDEGYRWTIEGQHLFALKQARSQLDWLIDRIERKHARTNAKKREA